MPNSMLTIENIILKTNFDQEKAIRRYFCGESGEKYFNLWNKCRLMLNKLNATDDTFAIVMVIPNNMFDN